MPISQSISMVAAHPAMQIVTPLQSCNILHSVVSTPMVRTGTQIGGATPFMSVAPTVCSCRSSASWVPHPHPHPATSSSVFWTPTLVSGVRTLPTMPLDANGATRLTGGWPLPGTMPATWTFGTWPPVALAPGLAVICPIILCPWLIPNPCNHKVRHVLWDVTQSPQLAKRRSSRWTITLLSAKYKDQATYPAVDTLYIVCDVGAAKDLWGPIVVTADSTVTVGDIFLAIYNYFQTPVSSEEADAICTRRGLDFEDVIQTFAKRCAKTFALPGYEWRQGLKRADFLGESTQLWGTWITYNADMSWQLNLGLVPDSR